MDYKVYIGEEKTSLTDIEGVKITFIDKPSDTDTIALDGATVILNFSSISESNEDLARLFADVTDGFSIFNVEYTEGNDYVIVKNVDESPLTTVISGDYATQQPLVLKETVIDYTNIDLFEDESVTIGQKLVDIEKLSNVFTDYSKTITIPATANNNKNFKYYFDIDNDLSFNANIKVPAYIEFESEPFKFGKLQLEKVKKKSGDVFSYDITFYGNTVQLTDLFKEDTIDKLDYVKSVTGEETKEFNSLSKYDFEYNGANVLSSIQMANFKDGNIITPLISYGERDWNYGTDDDFDIASTDGAINANELRQALRLFPIIEGIEKKYKISFSRDFINTASFKNLFIWMNELTSDISIEKKDLNISDSFTGTNDGSIVINGNFISLTGRKYSLSSGAIFNRRVSYAITPTDPTIKYDAFLVDDKGNTLKTWTNLSGNRTLTRDFNSKFYLVPSNELDTKTVKLMLLPKASMLFNCSVNARYIKVDTFSTNIYADITSTPNLNNLFVRVIIKDNLPKMKVIDFIQGLMKLCKLVIRPIDENTFYLNTLDRYYKDGNTLNISKYVDIEDILIERPSLYKEVSFNFQKTENVLGKVFRKSRDPFNDLIGYGDLRATYQTVESKETLKVDVPFENMLFERLDVLAPNLLEGETTNIMIGQSISTSDNITFSQNKSNPIIFYNKGIANNTRYPFKIKFGSTVATVYYNCLVGNTDDESIDQVIDSLNFGAEIDPWHLEEISASLYSNYWKNWMESVYDIKQRKYSFNTYLPKRFIKELSLNDTLIVGQNRYKINTFEGDLKDKSIKIKAFSDIYQWSYYDFPTFPGFKSYSFYPSSKYFTSFTTDLSGDYIYLYGNFTSYNGQTAGRIVKIDKTGEIDPTFVTGTGFNANTFANQLVLVSSNGDIIVTGNFTSYNGTTANRIIKLNSNGSIDTSFVYGTGFNNITSGVSIDSNNKTYICGSFTSYNGTSANRIIRLNDNGTVDTVFAYGAGFNNVTNSVAVNSDDTLIVTGYFSTYKGTSANKVVKILPNGNIDTSFAYGTGFTAPTNTPITILRVDDDNLFFYGSFTSYNGTSANRLIKLNRDGTINDSFDYGTGFNGVVSNVSLLSDGRLLVQGGFTQYNGQDALGNALILNQDGSINRVFESGLADYYNIGDLIYTTNSNGDNLFVSDESYPPLNRKSIITNAGGKYFDIKVLLKEDWSVEKVDLGDDIDWVDIYENGDICTIEVKQKLLLPEPSVYEVRKLDLAFTIGSSKYYIRVTQNGLEEI